MWTQHCGWTQWTNWLTQTAFCGAMTRAYCAIIVTPARLVCWGTWEKNGGKSMWFLLWQLWCSYGSMSLPAVPSRMPKLRTFSAATNRVGFDLGPKHIPTCHRCWYWFVFFSYPLMKSVFFSFQFSPPVYIFLCCFLSRMKQIVKSKLGTKSLQILNSDYFM